MIGTGNTNARFTIASSRVFETTVPNWYDEKKRAKCSRPTHGLSVKPPAGV